jgi:putative transcriptional regulator
MSTTKSASKRSRRGKSQPGTGAVPAGKKARRPGAMVKGGGDQPSVLDMVEESLHGLGRVKDIKTTLREFDRLKYPAPKEYGPAEIIRLREKKLHMSQTAFALACNAKLSTLQKWESGVNKPTPPVNRLFQLMERGGLAILEGGA